MKKIVSIILCICLPLCLFAEINGKPSRYVDIGVDCNVGVSNNYFAVSDLLKQTIVFDFNEVAKKLSKDQGLRFDGNTSVDVFVNVNTKLFGVGIFCNVDGSVYGSVPYQVFNLIATGIEQGKEKTDKLNLGAEFNTEIGAWVSFNLKAFKLTARPAVFVPILYAPSPDAEFKFESLSTDDLESTGRIFTASAKADLKLYSAFPVNTIDTNQLFEQLSSAGGFDMSLAMEYPLFERLDLGLSVKNIPIVPAKLKYNASYPVTASLIVNDLLAESKDTGVESKETDKVVTDVNYPKEVTFTTLEEPYEYIRPIKISFQGAFRPFNNEWLSLNPNLGFVVRDNLKIEGGLQVRSRLLAKVFDLSVSSNYTNNVWVEKFALGLNFRVIELDFYVSSQSADFIKSFAGAGLGAGVGVHIGF